jgi:hypothetical protein
MAFGIHVWVSAHLALPPGGYRIAMMLAGTIAMLLGVATGSAVEHGPTFGTAHKGCWTPPNCGGPGAPNCACKTFPQGIEVPVFNTTCTRMKAGRTAAAVLQENEGLCVMQHLWTGGSDSPATLYGSYRIRYYVDGEEMPSVNLPIGLSTGQPFGDNDGPWSAGAAFGKTGEPSGTFNTFPVPFSKSINVTVEIFQGGPAGSPSRGGFWIIVRGRSLFSTDADALTFPLPGSAGVQLPRTARLRTVESNQVAVPGGAHVGCNPRHLQLQRRPWCSLPRCSPS